MDVALVVHISLMHPHDVATDPAGFGIPAHVIAGFKCLGHDELPRRVPLSRLIQIAFQTIESTRCYSGCSGEEWLARRNCREPPCLRPPCPAARRSLCFVP